MPLLATVVTIDLQLLFATNLQLVTMSVAWFRALVDRSAVAGALTTRHAIAYDRIDLDSIGGNGRFNI